MNNFVVCLPINGQLVKDFSSFSLHKSLERIRSSLAAILFSNDVNEKANIDFSSHQKNNNHEYKKKSVQLLLLSP
jgi:hypothetical protein